MANLKQYIKTSFQDYGLPSDNHTGHSYSYSCAKEDIEYLYKKIKDFSRETTQWDLYKITQVISNQEEFQSQINSLPPYSSAIIAAKFAGDDGNSYNHGDLVYKNLDGSTTYIEAERGGVFRPSTIIKLDSENSNNNNYNLLFQYISKEPGEDDIDQVIGNSNGVWESKDTNKQQIEFQNITVNSPSSIYGIVKTSNDFSSGGFTFPLEKPFPIIKMYNSDNEEVYTDFNLKSNDNMYAISGIPSIVTTVVIK